MLCVPEVAQLKYNMLITCTLICTMLMLKYKTFGSYLYKAQTYLVTLQTLPELLHGKVILNSLE